MESPDVNKTEEDDQKAFIDYAPVGDSFEQVPIYVRPEVKYYVERMGFFPNAMKLYLHTPWIAEQIIRLNNAVMRDERNSLSERLKYRLAVLASRDNECSYCTSHNVRTLKQRWNHDDADFEQILDLDQPVDEREAVAMEFVHQASLDPAGVTDELRSKLADYFTPQEVMEIVLTMGFWKMYNTMHLAMSVPIEDPAEPYKDWVNYGQ